MSARSTLVKFYVDRGGGMRKTVIIFILLFSFLCGCGQEYECDIYRYGYDSYSDTYEYNYYTWDVYWGKSASEAEEACESDWSGSYDCRDCVKY